jgi:hypothetical protein
MTLVFAHPFLASDRCQVRSRASGMKINTLLSGNSFPWTPNAGLAVLIGLGIGPWWCGSVRKDFCFRPALPAERLSISQDPRDPDFLLGLMGVAIFGARSGKSGSASPGTSFRRDGEGWTR